MAYYINLYRERPEGPHIYELINDTGKKAYLQCSFDAPIIGGDDGDVWRADVSYLYDPSVEKQSREYIVHGVVKLADGDAMPHTILQSGDGILGAMGDMFTRGSIKYRYLDNSDKYRIRSTSARYFIADFSETHKLMRKIVGSKARPEGVNDVVEAGHYCMQIEHVLTNKYMHGFSKCGTGIVYIYETVVMSGDEDHVSKVPYVFEYYPLTRLYSAYNFKKTLSSPSAIPDDAWDGQLKSIMNYNYVRRQLAHEHVINYTRTDHKWNLDRLLTLDEFLTKIHYC